jgi:hypothetical protein
MTRRSLTYESRLHKYAARGFQIGIPGFQHAYVDKYRLPGWHYTRRLITQFS